MCVRAALTAPQIHKLPSQGVLPIMVRTARSIKADSHGGGPSSGGGAAVDTARAGASTALTMTARSCPKDLDVPHILISSETADSKLATMKEGSDSNEGSVATSPESTPGTGRRRKNWLASIVHMKNDLDSTLKRARDKLSVVSKRQSSSQTGRKIMLDIPSPVPSRRKHRHHQEPEETSFDQPNNNFSNSLVLLGLEDGMFCAYLPLDCMPKGDILIQVRNSKLIFVVSKTGEKLDSKHRMSQSFSCGYMELPIYIDPATIQIETDAENDNVLHLRAYLKGTMNRSQSVSPPSHGRLAVSPCEVRKSRSCGASPLLGDHRAKGKSPTDSLRVSPDVDEEDFRLRCNSR